jgi:hypothetical protein
MKLHLFAPLQQRCSSGTPLVPPHLTALGLQRNDYFTMSPRGDIAALLTSQAGPLLVIRGSQSVLSLGKTTSRLNTSLSPFDAESGYLSQVGVCSQSIGRSYFSGDRLNNDFALVDVDRADRAGDLGRDENRLPFQHVANLAFDAF